MITLYNKQGAQLLSIEVDGTSYAYREIMGDTRLMLYFSLATYVEIPTGAFCNFEGNRYEVMFPTSVKIQHRRDYEYTLEMRSADSVLAYYKFREVTYSSSTGLYGGSRRLKFSLTASPAEHLAMVVANLNERTDGGWTAGDCIASSEKVVTFCHASVLDALRQIAEAFDTEYEIENKTISLKKVEYYKSSPLRLEYGKGKGLKPGIQRTNQDSQGAIGVLFVQGSDRNIDSTKYDGAKELHLPKNGTIGYDGTRFSNESGYTSSSARVYQADAEGWSLTRVNPAATSGIEESIDLTDIYPTKEHTILKVITVDATKHWYDIVINAAESLDYKQCQIKGETAVVAFQDKMLAGKEFDIQTTTNGILSISKYYENSAFVGWRIPLKPETIDDVEMPGGNFIPEVNGKIKIFGIHLPSDYIRQDSDKSGAEWDLFREAVKYMYDNEEQKFTLKAEIDGIWAKTNWNNISRYMRCGAYIRFVDSSIQSSGKVIRITGIKTYVNNPRTPEVTLSNESVRPSIAATLKEIDNSKYESEQLYRKSLDFSRRRFRDAAETMSLLEEAFVDDIHKYTSGIKPAFVQTMQTIVGDESLQFRWVRSFSDLSAPSNPWNLNIGTTSISIPSGYLQHMTLGISDLTVAERSASDYMIWRMTSQYIPMNSLIADKAYYIYAKVSKTTREGDNSYEYSTIPISLEQVAGHYHLLIGILNSEVDGTRDFAPLYGFTEILPGRITAENIYANWLNLAEGARIGDWKHTAGKIQSEGDEIVLDSQNDLIEIGRRLRLTPNMLKFLKTAGGSEAALQISGDPVGAWRSIPIALSASNVTWMGNGAAVPDTLTNGNGLNEVSETLFLGVLKSGHITVKAGTGFQIKVPQAYYDDNNHEEIRYDITARPSCVVKILRGSAIVASRTVNGSYVSSGSNASAYITSELFVNVSTEAEYSVVLEMSVSVQSQGVNQGTSQTFFSEPSSRIIYDATSQGEEETLLAPDGLRSVWGDGYLFLDKDTFVVRKGTNLIKVSKDGNHFSNDGGETWQEIGVGGQTEGSGGGSVTVDSALSATSGNPVRNSAIYAGLQGKQNTITGAATSITDSNLASGRVLVSNANGKVSVSSITSTILGYLSGLTSNVQSQIDGKATLSELQSIFLQIDDLAHEIDSLGILDGKQDNLVSGTNIKTINGQSLLGAGDIVIQTGGGGGGTSIGSLTPSRVLISDASGDVAASQITTILLGYLSGLTGNIQTQLNGKMNITSLSGYVTEQALGDERYDVSGLINDAGYLNEASAKTSGFIKLDDLDGAELSLLNLEVSEEIYIGDEEVATQDWVTNKGYVTVSAISGKQDKMGLITNDYVNPYISLEWNKMYYFQGSNGYMETITLNAPSFTSDLTAEIVVRIAVTDSIPEVVFDMFDYIFWANGERLYPNETYCVYEYSIAPYEDGVLIVGAKFKN